MQVPLRSSNLAVLAGGRRMVVPGTSKEFKYERVSA
jgi:hypothetical protein